MGWVAVEDDKPTSNNIQMTSWKTATEIALSSTPRPHRGGRLSPVGPHTVNQERFADPLQVAMLEVRFISGNKFKIDEASHILKDADVAVVPIAMKIGGTANLRHEPSR